jgi:Ni/Fe-hydrogenase subunit HybB-like protein
VLVLLGFITNRLNVSITGMERAAGVHYFPKWTEIAVTASIIASGFAIFGLAVKYFPVFPTAEQPEQSSGQEAARSTHVLTG